MLMWKKWKFIYGQNGNLYMDKMEIYNYSKIIYDI